MNTKVGRNDPCPCGSGKKYKACCLQKNKPVTASGKKKFTAKMLTTPKPINLIERTYGHSIAAAQQAEKPSVTPPESTPEAQ